MKIDLLFRLFWLNNSKKVRKGKKEERARREE